MAECQRQSRRQLRPRPVSAGSGTAMLALLGIVGAVLVMSKEQRR